MTMFPEPDLRHARYRPGRGSQDSPPSSLGRYRLSASQAKHIDYIISGKFLVFLDMIQLRLYKSSTLRSQPGRRAPQTGGADHDAHSLPPASADPGSLARPDGHPDADEPALRQLNGARLDSAGRHVRDQE